MISNATHEETYMVRSFTGSTVLRLALVATAACSLAACQSKPKPTYPTQTTGWAIIR